MAKRSPAPKGRIRAGPKGKSKPAPTEGLRLVAEYLVSTESTRTEVEALLGVGNGYLSSMLRGRRHTPGAELMGRFRDVLGVPLEAWTQRAQGKVPEVPRFL